MQSPSARPRYLLIANTFPPITGGSAIVYENIARYADGAIIVLAPSKNYFDGLPIIGRREYDRNCGFDVVRIPLLRTILSPDGGASKFEHLLADLSLRCRVLIKISQILLRYRIRLLCIGELVASSWLITVFRWIPGFRTIVYIHGEELSTRDSYDDDFSRRRRALRSADGVVVVSRFTKAMVEDLGGSSSPIALITNGVDGTRFTPRRRSAELWQRYDLKDEFVFITVCRLLQKKGIDHAIAAFARVKSRHRNCRFIVVGEGPAKPQLESLAQSHGIADSVTFTGKVPTEELSDHYALGDCFIMPNRRMEDGDTEGFGLVFLEANAVGVPVIAGSDGGSTDAVTNDVNGLVVNGHSIDEIHQAMLRMIEEPELRARLRVNGLDVAARSSWKDKAKEFVAFCEQISA